MVHHSPDLGTVFKALGHPARRSILDRLRGGERPIGELAALFEMSLPVVSKHIRVLESAGLLEVRLEGRVRLCRLVPEPLRAGEEWISRFRMFWESELDQVERSSPPTKVGGGGLSDLRAEGVDDPAACARGAAYVRRPGRAGIRGVQQSGALAPVGGAPGAQDGASGAGLPGRQYRREMRFPDGSLHVLVGEYPEIDAPRRLVYSYAWETIPGPDTRVEIELVERAGSRTRNTAISGSRFFTCSISTRTSRDVVPSLPRIPAGDAAPPRPAGRQQRTLSITPALSTQRVGCTGVPPAALLVWRMPGSAC